jgi:hypothetical protein
VVDDEELTIDDIATLELALELELKDLKLGNLQFWHGKPLIIIYWPPPEANDCDDWEHGSML